MPATNTARIVIRNGRTLFRFILRAAHNRNAVRVCEQWHDCYVGAEAAAHRIAAEWGGKRPMKVALVYPVPMMPHATHAAAGAP